MYGLLKGEVFMAQKGCYWAYDPMRKEMVLRALQCPICCVVHWPYEAHREEVS